MTLFSLKFKKTKIALLVSGLVTEPLMQAYILIPFILRKDLNASVFQLATLTSLKYVLAAFCIYWISSLHDRKDKLKSNILWAGLFMRLPFFLFPFVNNPWVFVILAGMYKLFYKASTPAWIEVLKLNLPHSKRSSLFAYSAALAYGAGVVMLPFLGVWMDHSSQIWRWLFPMLSAVSMLALYFQVNVPIELDSQPKRAPSTKALKDYLWTPWIKLWSLIRKEKEFAYFHGGYMLCGMGVLLLQPIVPIICVDRLKMDYLDYAVALGLFKGVALSLSSPFWGTYFQRASIFIYSGIIFSMMGFFALSLLLSFAVGPFWIYLAHLIYGIALAGDHISWNLSATTFSKEQESTSFSSVNVLLLGLRSCVAPFLGGLFHYYFGLTFVLCLSGICCFASAYYMFQKKAQPQFAY